MNATTGQKLPEKAPAPKIPPGHSILERWRSADNEDGIWLRRDDVSLLTDEMRAADTRATDAEARVEQLIVMAAEKERDAEAAAALVIEKAAKMLESRAELLVQDEGSWEPDTNVTNLPEWAESECEVLEESARLIRALAPASGVEELARLRAQAEKAELDSKIAWALLTVANDNTAAVMAEAVQLRADLEAARARDGWQPPEDRPEGYRCLGWTEDGWVVVTWVQMGSDASRWFTDWYPERDDTPTAFAPLPAALAAAPAQNGGGIGPTSLVADQSGKSTFDR